MEENIKIEIIGKTILLSILTIIISLCILFFYGISKVEAETITGPINSVDLIWKNNGSTYKTTNCTAFPCQDSYIGGTATNFTAQYKFNSVSWGSATFDWDFNIGLGLMMLQNNTEIPSGTIGIYQVTSNGTRTNITNSCSINGLIPRPFEYVIGNLTHRGTKYEIYIHCTGIKPSGNMEYQLVEWTPANSTYIYEQLWVGPSKRTWTENEAEATRATIDNAASSIRGSISENTNRVLSKMSELWNEYKGTWENITFDSRNYQNINPNNATMNDVINAEDYINGNFGVPAGAIGDISTIHNDTYFQNASLMIWTTIEDFTQKNEIIWPYIVTFLFLMVIATLLNR